MTPATHRHPSVWITVLCAAAGAIGYVFLHDSMSFLDCLLLGVLVGEGLRLRGRASRAEARLAVLERQASAPAPATTTQTATVAVAATPATAATPVMPPVAAGPVPVAVVTPAVADVRPVDPAVARPAAPIAPTPTPQAAPTPPRPPAPPSAIETFFAQAMDWLRGGNTVARVGVVVLFFGGAFLAKYAAEHGHFPIEWRMASLAAGALGLLGFGFVLRRRRPGYGQTLQGGGIAGFYLVVFAATRLYHLLPLSMALALMVAVALAGAVLAVMQEALALAVLGIGGGFLAPLLVSTGSGDAFALFGYYTLLNLGIFAIAWFRAWRVLNLLGFVFTFGIAGLFRTTALAATQTGVADGFLLLFFAMYLAVTVLFALRQPTNLRHYVSGSLVFGLPLVTFPLHASYVHAHAFATAWSALAFGVVYLALAMALLHRPDPRTRTLAEAFAALGVIFGSLAIPLAFDSRTTAALWAVEGAGLVWLGLRQQRVGIRLFGLALQLLGGSAFFLHLDALQGTRAFLNAGYVGSLLVGGAGVLSAVWLRRVDAVRTADAPPPVFGVEREFAVAILLWGLVWLLTGIGVELARALPDAVLGVELGFAAATGLALWQAAARLQWPLLRGLAIGALTFAGIVGLVAAVPLDHPFAQWAFVGWPLWFGVAYVLLHRRDADTPQDGLSTVLHLSLAFLLGLVVVWELGHQIHREIDGVWPWLPLGLVPAAALWALSGARLRPAWPLAAHDARYRLGLGALLAVIVTLWTLVLTLSGDGRVPGIAYVPLLNPIELGTLIAMVAAVAWWRGLGGARQARLFPDAGLRVPQFAAAFAFLWVNAALLRALHTAFDVPFEFTALMRSVPVQATLSIFWGALGFVAMTLGSRRGRRLLWMVGAGLMAAVVAKLFLVDTAASGTLARVLAFLVVGGLLLVTGYLAPLPPRKPEIATPPPMDDPAATAPPSPTADTTP